MIWLGYGSIAALFVLIVVVIERTRRTGDFSDYATGGRSFGSFASTMAFINTWLPGTMFIAFAGYAASSGVIGLYYLPYSLIAVLLMVLLAKPVTEWGKRFDLRTQADLLGLRYGSNAVRVIAAIIGIVALFPWLVLGFQSLTYVFTYLSFGAVEATTAVFVGIGVLLVRQIWTVRLGVRGLIISDVVQGIVAYGIGTLVALGMLTWLVTNGHGFGELPPEAFTIPGPGSAVGGLYYFSIVATGALGAWSWPDIFVRLFSSRGTATVQRSAAQTAPIIVVFGLAVGLVALAAGSLPEVQAQPDAVWFLVAERVGPAVVILAGLAVLAATMGNAGAILQAIGIQAANDIVGPLRNERVESPRVAKIAVGVSLVGAAIVALLTANTSTGLITLALVSYQGIVQLAPTLFFGIFWRRGTALAASVSMLVGFGTAAVLQWIYPVAIPWLDGVTSGIVGVVVNALVYVAITLARPAPAAERERVDALFDALRTPASRAAAVDVESARA